MNINVSSTGLVDAMNAAAILLEDGRGTSNGLPDLVHACMWYLEAAKQGSEQAAINLAITIKHHLRQISYVDTRLGVSSVQRPVYVTYLSYLILQLLI